MKYTHIFLGLLIFVLGVRLVACSQQSGSQVAHELLQRTYGQQKMWLRKWYNWYEYHLVKQAEMKRCRKADLVLVTCERERLILS